MHLDRIITLLETIATAGRPLSVMEVQQATELPRPTCYRLLQTMTDHGLLDDQDGDSKYVLGDRLIRIALLGTSDVDVRQAATPLMKEAANRLGQTVFLSRIRHKKVEIIHVEIPNDPRRSYFHPGLGSRPMHACSCSKAIAAFAEESLQDEVLSGPMKAYTEHTKVTEVELRQELSEILDRGYAECVEEIEVGVSSVAAPIQIRNIGVMFSVGSIGSIRTFTPSTRSRIGHELIELSEKIATTIQLTNREGLLPDELPQKS